MSPARIFLLLLFYFFFSLFFRLTSPSYPPRFARRFLPKLLLNISTRNVALYGNVTTTRRDCSRIRNATWCSMQFHRIILWWRRWETLVRIGIRKIDRIMDDLNQLWFFFNEVYIGSNAQLEIGAHHFRFAILSFSHFYIDYWRTISIEVWLRYHSIISIHEFHVYHKFSCCRLDDEKLDLINVSNSKWKLIQFFNYSSFLPSEWKNRSCIRTFRISIYRRSKRKLLPFRIVWNRCLGSYPSTDDRKLSNEAFNV